MLGKKGEKRRPKLNNKKGHTGLEAFQRGTDTCTRQKFDLATSRYEKNIHLGDHQSATCIGTKVGPKKITFPPHNLHA